MTGPTDDLLSDTSAGRLADNLLYRVGPASGASADALTRADRDGTYNDFYAVAAAAITANPHSSPESPAR